MASRSSITAGIRIVSASASASGSSSSSSSSRLLQHASRQASSSSSSSMASLLKTTPAAALATPGLTFTSPTSKHPHAPQPQTSSINMCTSLSPRYFSTSVPTPSLQPATSASPSAASPPSPPPATLQPQTKHVRVTYSPERKYPARKSFLYNAYARLLASSDLVVLLQYGNLTVSEWNKLRSDLTAIPTPSSNTPRASIVAVRAALLRALLRSHPNAHVNKLANACSGPLAFLYFPTAALVRSVSEEKEAPAAPEGQQDSTAESPTIDDIDPRYVEKVLTVIDKAFGAKAVPAPPKDLDPFSAATLEGTQLTQGNPRILPLGALFYPSRAVQPASSPAAAESESSSSSTAVPEGFEAVPESAQPPTRLLPVLSLRAIASHSPDLATLRAQMVGLIGAPAQSLVGILAAAGGAGLVRVLRGYVAGLEQEGEKDKDA
ncbi:hypothetical protein OC861_003327 [Tilletia horrida]|nr:hypothetical protein OC861_003327 [Tilletia horrida]